MRKPKYPSLYQINTRVWLTDLSKELGKPASLDDIPDIELKRIADLDFEWLWLLSVWTTGPMAQKVSRTNPEWRHDFKQTLPDLKEKDIGGSGFAIADYKVHPNLGGNTALKRFRARLNKIGIKLMLDFVPNHMGLDHPWVQVHPEYFVSGTEDNLKQTPQNYTRVKSNKDDLILAYGRDPNFSGWPDTLQLDYSNPATVDAMTKELIRIAGQCDGVRCDMAMLLLPDVFERTWGRTAQSFWPESIKAVREQSPDFCFMAEVYWDMEWTLQQQGFDYTYDKRLYDRLREGNVPSIQAHFQAGLEYQDKLARFLENHDEPRAVATFGPEQSRAAAVITFFSPGMKFFHQGQLEGKTKRISPHLIRAPRETLNKILQDFYTSLLSVLKLPLVREGEWNLLSTAPAWESNSSHDSFIAFSWQSNDQRMVIVINYAPHSSQCFLNLHFNDLYGASWRLTDLLSEAAYERDGDDLHYVGLYLDMQAWQYHAFEMKRINAISEVNREVL